MIGKAIRHFREVRELTQTKLSELTDFGVSTINSYEKGKRNPGEERLQILAQALGVTVNDIKEVAESLAKEETSTEPVIDDKHLRRRLDFIYGRSDGVVELSKYVLLSIRAVVHDVVSEINRKRSMFVHPRERRLSPIESIAEKVVAEFIAENLDEISLRLQDELKRNEVNINEIIENMRKDNNY